MAGLTLTNIYNHYLTTYSLNGSRPQSSLHKKDELRNVYKSIVKKSQSAPLVLLSGNSSDHAEQSAIDIKERARLLKGRITDIHEIGDKNTIGQKTAFSSEEDVATASYIGTNDDNPPSFSLKVDQLATNQINTGNFLSDTEVSLPPGDYAFNIRTGDQNYEIQYAVRENETNRDLQSRLSRLINKAGIGLNAGLVADRDGRTALSISSRATGLPIGKDSQFEISEESDTGMKGSVAYLGIDQKEQAARDARFFVNGAEKTSPSNRFHLGKSYELNLKRRSGDNEEVIIGIKDSRESLMEHIHSLVDGYNSFLDGIEKIDTKSFRKGRLLNETIAVARENLNSSEAASHLMLGEDGRLSINEEELEKASNLSSNELNEKLSTVKDFAKALYDKAASVALDPMQYISKPIVAYKNPGRIEFPNPYITSEYSGMLFNNYC